MDTLPTTNGELNNVFRVEKTFKAKAEPKIATFLDCIWLIRFVSRIFGFSPFSFAYRNGKVVGTRVNVFDMVWFAISLAVRIILIYYLPCNLPQNWNTSPALLYEHYLQLFSGLMCGIFTTISDMYNRNRITNIYLNINRFDVEVNSSRLFHLVSSVRIVILILIFLLFFR